MADKEYVERGALLKRFAELHDGGDWLVNNYNADWIHSFIETATAADVVPRDMLKQVKWERDVAIKQLEEHGIPFGGKADVVEVRHGEWMRSDPESDVLFYCSECDTEISTSWDYQCDEMWRYCPCCGAKMDGERKEQT